MANRRTPKQFPRFEAALSSLGSNDYERAAVLGISHRSVQELRAGNLCRVLRALMNRPFTLRALADDAEGMVEDATEAEWAAILLEMRDA